MLRLNSDLVSHISHSLIPCSYDCSVEICFDETYEELKTTDENSVLGYSKLFVEFKCPLCRKDLDDDKSMANFMVCNDASHGTLRFFTGDGCYFTTNQDTAEKLMKEGKRVHIVEPREFFGDRTINLE